MDPLYYAHVLRHYKKPLNCEVISDYTFEKVASNHLCGDQVCVRILLVNCSVLHISIQAKGCVVSVATASILSEYVKGRSCRELLKLSPEVISGMLGMPLGPVRLKCALLSFDAIVQGLRECGCNQ